MSCRLFSSIRTTGLVLTQSSGIQRKQAVHAAAILFGECADAPHQPPPGLEAVFLASAGRFCDSQHPGPLPGERPAPVPPVCSAGALWAAPNTAAPSRVPWHPCRTPQAAQREPRRISRAPHRLADMPIGCATGLYDPSPAHPESAPLGCRDPGRTVRAPVSPLVNDGYRCCKSRPRSTDPGRSVAIAAGAWTPLTRTHCIAGVRLSAPG